MSQISKLFRELGKERSPVQKKFASYAFIHVGKCGGSYLARNLPRSSTIHMRKPEAEPNVGYIIWLRNPLSRFVSAFNHSLALVEYDVGTKNFDDLYNDESCPYYRLKNKINSVLETGEPFCMWDSGSTYVELMRYFGTANALAEGLSSSDRLVRDKAKWLMSNAQVEHIYKGLGWYMDNGKFIREHHDQIFFVGRQEQMSQDLNALFSQLGVGLKQIDRPIRQGQAEADKYLSEVAIANLKDFYARSDYKALSELARFGFIDQNLIKEYLTYADS